jgi:hypothetical protein
MLRAAKLTAENATASRLGSFIYGVIAMNRKPGLSGSIILKPARIEPLGGHGSSICLVRSASDTKAVLEVENPLEFPIEFDLLTEPDQRRQRCGVVWRKTKSLGVAFI